LTKGHLAHKTTSEVSSGTDGEEYREELAIPGPPTKPPLKWKQWSTVYLPSEMTFCEEIKKEAYNGRIATFAYQNASHCQ